MKSALAGHETGQCPGHSEAEALGYIEAIHLEMESEYPETTKEYYRARGMDFIGIGGERMVFALCDEHVLKIDYGDLDANAREGQVWDEADAELRQFLAPVFDYGGSETMSWLVAGRCDEYAGERPSWMRSGTETALGDTYGGNVGIYDGRLVLLDYPMSRSEVREFRESLGLAVEPTVVEAGL